MLAARLVQIIEDHSEQITTSLLEQIHGDPRLKNFSGLPDSLLIRRFNDVCGRLSSWLMEKDEEVIAKRYEDLGRERFTEGVPLNEVVLAAQLFRRCMLKFARRQAADTPIEVYAEEELQQLMDGFFDRCIYHIVKGYEQAFAAAQAQPVGAKE